MVSTQPLKQQLWQEIEQFSWQQLWELLNFIYYLKFKTTHQLSFVTEQTIGLPSDPLARAAQVMLADYTTDRELTAFTALHGLFALANLST